MTLEYQLIAGRRLERRIGKEQIAHLYYEVWRSEEEARRGLPPRARFIVEITTLSGRMLSKVPFDNSNNAEYEFNTFERRFAIEQAKEALGLNDLKP